MPTIPNPSIDPYIYRALARTQHVVNTTEPHRLTAFGVFIVVDGTAEFMELAGDLTQVYAYSVELANQACARIPAPSRSVN